MQKDLYQITITMTDEEGGRGITAGIECTDDVISLRETFDDYAEIEQLLLEDIASSVECYVHNLVVLETRMGENNE